MGKDHDKLISEYENYKKCLAEYEKEKYLYDSKIEEHGKNITQQLSKLRSLGVTIDGIDDLVDDKGEIDLTDRDKVKELLSVVYSTYRKKIDEGLKLIRGDSNGC